MLFPITRPTTVMTLASVVFLSLVVASKANGATKVTTIAVPNGGQPATAIPRAVQSETFPRCGSW